MEQQPLFAEVIPQLRGVRDQKSPSPEDSLCGGSRSRSHKPPTLAILENLHPGIRTSEELQRASGYGGSPTTVKSPRDAIR